MSEKNSLSLFDELAIEILFEIFDYLSCNDIIYTFFYLNQRFNSILLQHHRFLNNFSIPTHDFSFWQTILPIISSQIKCLTITTTDFAFSLDFFPNLKSLIISSSLPIYHDELNFILKSEQFKKLNSFKIKSEIVKKKVGYEKSFFDKVFYVENSLHTFESLLELSSSFANVNSLRISVNLQSLSLKVLQFSLLFSLLYYTPNLKYLNVLLLSFRVFNDQLNPNTDLSEIELKKLSLVLKSDSVNQKLFTSLTQFIKEFSSSLIYLSLNLNQINTNDFQFDGFTLQQQFLESMIQLKSFHLYTQLNKEPMDVESFLSTFETQFWFDHHWTFGIHGTYFYTLPFHFDQLKDFIDFDDIKSSNPKILNSSQAWSHVKSIDFSESFKFSSNLIRELKLKMPNVTSTIFSSSVMNNFYTNNDETNQTNITLDGITTVHCQGASLQDIKQWLINISPNTRHLMLSYDPQPAASSSVRRVFLHILDAYFRDKRTTADYIYSSKIEYVEIKIILRDMDCVYQDVICFVKELLKMFKNLQSFLFHFYHLPYAPTIIAFTDLSKMIQLLNMEKISEKYQIKHIHHYLQFIRKNNK